MTLEGLDDEEWDADFVNQLIQAEENATQPKPPLPSLHSLALPPRPSWPPERNLTHSPPRELSQRVKNENTEGFEPPYSNGVYHIHSSTTVAPPMTFARCSKSAEEELENDRLKKELGQVSKQLTQLEQECSELKRERDSMKQQLRSVFLQAKDAEVHPAGCTNTSHCRWMCSHRLSRIHTRECGVLKDHWRISLGCQNRNSLDNQVDFQNNAGTSARKTIGVQTDKASVSTDSSVRKNLSTTSQCSKKLRDVWDPPSGQQLGKDLVSKLIVACETDFHVLMGCLSSNITPKTTIASRALESPSSVALQRQKPTANSLETAKVSHLYSVLTKVSSGMVTLDALLEALVDLCGLQNVLIVSSSLHVLRMVLNHLFFTTRKPEARNNVIIEGSSSGTTNTADMCGSRCSKIKSLLDVNANETSDPGQLLFGTRMCSTKNVCSKEVFSYGRLVSWADSLFGLMNQISMQFNEEHIRVVAVSLMNVILMQTNAYLEREKYGRVAFQGISKFLRKEAGFGVQKEAVHLLHLLLNCPNVMALFCSGCKEEVMNAGAGNNDAINASSFQGFSDILDGLADCVISSGDSIQGLKLRRNAIILLAFLASSGKPGFEIMLGHQLSNGANFLVLILQIVISEMDVEASESVQPSELFKERTLLIREALIFLNRLVSNPQYSALVLRVLASSRDTASLTTDTANRLTQKEKWFWQSDSVIRHIRESEIVELAKAFEKRVYAFLDGLS